MHRIGYLTAIGVLTILGLAGSAVAQGGAVGADAASLRTEIEKQRALIEAQQQQLEQLRAALAGQSARLEELSRAVKPEAVATVPAAAMPAPASAPAPSPLQLHIGTASITPVGFMDFTSVFRTSTGGSGIGTNFGAIPYANTTAGKLTESRFSGQNSRVGFRVDAQAGQTSVLGYLESDFLGFSPGNAAVSSNSNSLRLRLYWVDLKRNKLEILAGQSWSLLTPNRKGLSPLPGDLFYGQAIDVNYLAGLTWGRNPQLRLVYHPRDTVAVGLSLEAAEQYGGGSAGGSVVTLPAALAASYASQLNTGGNTFGVPNLHPDVIGKIAFDPKWKRAAHFEIAGLLSDFRFYNPLTAQHYTATGGGAAFNFNVEAAKNFRFVVNSYYSDGGGRWLFGQAPDLIIRPDGKPSLIHAASTVSGLEYQATPNTLWYAYYGGIYIKRNFSADPATGQLSGYGYTGSPDSQNRAIQEATFGVTRTLWKNSNYGALSFMAQYAYLTRSPWYAAAGHAPNAAVNMVFLNLRYALPGAPPPAK